MRVSKYLCPVFLVIVLNSCFCGGQRHNVDDYAPVLSQDVAPGDNDGVHLLAKRVTTSESSSETGGEQGLSAVVIAEIVMGAVALAVLIAGLAICAVVIVRARSAARTPHQPTPAPAQTAPRADADVIAIESMSTLPANEPRLFSVGARASPRVSPMPGSPSSVNINFSTGASTVVTIEGESAAPSPRLVPMQLPVSSFRGVKLSSGQYPRLDVDEAVNDEPVIPSPALSPKPAATDRSPRSQRVSPRNLGHPAMAASPSAHLPRTRSSPRNVLYNDAAPARSPPPVPPRDPRLTRGPPPPPPTHSSVSAQAVSKEEPTPVEQFESPVSPTGRRFPTKPPPPVPQRNTSVRSTGV
eukprot:TRINITY_DN31584_c0_g1_i1.p1 TRINITY_DN31584_c0_g1~~TRINITY_DN31584_c0_g1_i1.p1  ORF type:complete len:355 (-),score=61.28 TRINITY_DN31584_c0_g1_i1:539-1603(-)